MSNFQKLRESAEKATPGEWQQGFLHDGHEFIPSNNSGRVQKSDGTTFVPGSYEDAAFIAAANPSAILSLLDKIDALEKDAKRYKLIRTLNPLEFQHLYVENLRTGTPFDQLVDNKCPNPTEPN